MYDRVIVKFKEEDLMYRGEMDVLTEGVCEGILPISIVKKDKEVTGFILQRATGGLPVCMMSAHIRRLQ